MKSIKRPVKHAEDVVSTAPSLAHLGDIYLTGISVSDMDDSTRRQFLRMTGMAGTIGVTGCLRGSSGEGTPTPESATATPTSGSNIKDTDGDGVIDSEDYAPRDASVQRAEQVQEVDSTGTGEQNPTEEQPPGETETVTNRPDSVTTGIYDDFEDGELSNPSWRARGDDSRNDFGIADTGHNSQQSLYLDHNGSINNFWVESSLGQVVSPSVFSFWMRPTGRDQYSKDMFRIRNGETDVIWFTNHRQNDGVYFRFGPGNDEEDRERVRDGAITMDVDGFIEVKMEGINWAAGTIGEVYIDDERVTTNAPFLNRMSGFNAVAPYSVGFGSSAFRVDDIQWQ